MNEAAPTTVLIIDDDDAFRKLLEIRLRRILGQPAITQCNSLAAARRTLEGLRGREVERFDLVMLDQHLSDGTGVDLLREGWFTDLAVLSVSSDPSPEVPGATIGAGATYFLSKVQVTEPLFEPLVRGVIERNRLQRELQRARLEMAVIDSVKTLVNTLRHEVNNPLGAVLGAAYLLSTDAASTEQQREAAKLVDSSGRRIKHVLDELCKAVKLEPVKKASEQVFHIPGDEPWVGPKKS